MSTPEEVKKLKIQITDLERQMKSARSALNRIYRNCDHRWGPIKSDPIYNEGYTIPGDPPGTMGIDWRGPAYVPSETIPRWTRACKKCDLTQETRRTEDEVHKIPVF